MLLALDAARSAGASYADARIMRGNIESITTRERQITGVSKTETYGIGVGRASAVMGIRRDTGSHEGCGRGGGETRRGALLRATTASTR